MKQLITLLSCSCIFMTSISAATVTVPEAGKYYRIKHNSGLYLTNDAFKAHVEEMAENNTQIVRFIPVEGMENVYNIERVGAGYLLGSDKNWNSAIISRDHALSRFEILPSDVQDGTVTLRNLGLQAIKGANSCLGTDNVEQDKTVYTDKTGNYATRSLWEIEEAELYPEQTENLPDKYADKQLPEGDVRADAYPGYKLVFAQEFSTDGMPDADVWKYETGFMRNQEHQYYYGNRNSYVQDGVLVIEARDVSAENKKNPKYRANDNSWPSNIGPTLKWTSGSMQTKGVWNGGYSWKYGIYEVRAKIPQVNGCWPAIWSTGMSQEWPYGGEIDIMEYYGYSIHGNVCWGNGNRWGATWNSAIVRDSDLGPGWGDDYHLWRMVWDYDHMELWCDDWLVNNINLDETVNKIPSDNFDHGNGNNPFRDVRHMLWLNLAIGGQNGGDPYNPAYPARYLIDYARVYQKVGTDGAATYKVEETVSEPSFTLKDGEWNPAIAGVEEVSMADENDAPVKYYSLQGVELSNPTPGSVVIRACGNEISKQIYK